MTREEFLNHCSEFVYANDGIEAQADRLHCASVVAEMAEHDDVLAHCFQESMRQLELGMARAKALLAKEES